MQSTQPLLQPELLLNLPVKDLLNLCSVDKEIQKRCSQDSFWQLLSTLKFGPGLAESCAKELYLVKSLLGELFDSEVFEDAIASRKFNRANLLLKLGFPYDLRDIAYLITTDDAYDKFIRDTLQVLVENRIDLTDLNKLIRNYKINNIDVIPTLLSYNFDFIADKSYFKIASNLDELTESFVDDYYTKKVEQVLMEFLNYLLADPSFNINELSEDGDTLLRYINYKPARQLLIDHGAVE